LSGEFGGDGLEPPGLFSEIVGQGLSRGGCGVLGFDAGFVVVDEVAVFVDDVTAQRGFDDQLALGEFPC